MLWNLTILNFMSDQLSVFVEIEFGGSREECKVQVLLLCLLLLLLPP